MNIDESTNAGTHVYVIDLGYRVSSDSKHQIGLERSRVPRYKGWARDSRRTLGCNRWSLVCA